eukprot:1506150-Amphidinium_carterae.2
MAYVGLDLPVRDPSVTISLCVVVAESVDCEQVEGGAWQGTGQQRSCQEHHECAHSKPDSRTAHRPKSAQQDAQ